MSSSQVKRDTVKSFCMHCWFGAMAKTVTVWSVPLRELSLVWMPIFKFEKSGSTIAKLFEAEPATVSFV